MSITAKPYSITLIEPRGELHFTVAGFWDVETLQSFLSEINEASLPLIKARKPIRALGDFGESMPQDKQISEAIHNHLMNAKQFGLEKIAILKASPLTTMQYRRLSEGLAVEFFDNQNSALDWLRQP